jgi:hypothetical protein
LRNCAQAHAIALADQGKACSNAKSVVFMQRSEMKKILGKFEMHFLFLFLLWKKEKKNNLKLSFYTCVKTKKYLFLFFCLDTKETKDQEATSRSGKKCFCCVATIVGAKIPTLFYRRKRQSCNETQQLFFISSLLCSFGESHVDCLKLASGEERSYFGLRFFFASEKRKK